MGYGKVFEDPDHLWHDNICCALVFNGQFVDEHHDLAKAFTKAYLDAGTYLDEHPKGTRGRFPLKVHEVLMTQLLNVSLKVIWI